MQISSFSLGPVGTNCYVIQRNKEAIIIDPGAEAEHVIHWLEQEELKPLAILLTHAHFDHIGAVKELRNHYQIPVYVHAAESDWLEDPSLNGSLPLRGMKITAGKPDFLIEPGKLTIGPFIFEVMHTPGHSPGSVSFYLEGEKRIFSGDVLFNQGIGRTDLAGGDFNVLKDSIQHKLYQLPDDVTVYPGHGPTTTIGEEKQHNPFVRL